MHEKMHQCTVVEFNSFSYGGFNIVTLKSLEFVLFFLRIFSQLHALLEPPRLLISEKPATNSAFFVINIKKFPTTGIPRLVPFQLLWSLV